MASLLYLLKAFVIGLAIAAPVGPIGLLCIRKTLQRGLAGGLAVGLGAALADTFYGFIAGAGLTIISDFLLTWIAPLKLLGGGFLLYMAFQELRVSPHAQKAIPSHRKSFLQLCSQTFFLTLANPLTILSFIAIFASIGGGAVDIDDALWMVVGVFIGSMAWWCFLASITSHAKGYLSNKALHRIRFFSAFILLGFGLWAFGSGVWGLVAAMTLP